MLKRSVYALALGLLGALVAAIGAGSHRSAGYLGVALALVLIASAGVFAKAWQSWTGYTAFAALWAAATMYFAGPGPGQSTLVASDLKGNLLVYGGAVVLTAIAIVPRSILVGRDVAS